MKCAYVEKPVLLYLSFIFFFFDTMAHQNMLSSKVVGPVVMSAVTLAEVVSSLHGMPEGIEGLNSLEHCPVELIKCEVGDVFEKRDGLLWRKNGDSDLCCLVTRFSIGRNETVGDITRSEIEQCLESSLIGKYTRNYVQDFLKPFEGESYGHKRRTVANILINNQHPNHEMVKATLEELQKKAVAAGDVKRLSDRKIAAGCSVGFVLLSAVAYAVAQSH